MNSLYTKICHVSARKKKYKSNTVVKKMTRVIYTYYCRFERVSNEQIVEIFSLSPSPTKRTQHAAVHYAMFVCNVAVPARRRQLLIIYSQPLRFLSPVASVYIPNYIISSCISQ